MEVLCRLSYSSEIQETCGQPSTPPEICSGKCSQSAGSTSEGVLAGLYLMTVTVTVEEVAELPAPSKATAVSLCVPKEAGRVFQVNA